MIGCWVVCNDMSVRGGELGLFISLHKNVWCTKCAGCTYYPVSRWLGWSGSDHSWTAELLVEKLAVFQLNHQINAQSTSTAVLLHCPPFTYSTVRRGVWILGTRGLQSLFSSPNHSQGGPEKLKEGYQNHFFLLRAGSDTNVTKM